MVKKTFSETIPTESQNPKSANSPETKQKETQKKSPCCMGTTPCPSSATQTTLFNTSATSSHDSKKGPKTRIIIKYDVGFNNSLTLRGKGANLSWEKGIPLKNIKADEWVWETDTPFTSCEFKVLINDKHYEVGNNHTLICGARIQYTPKF